MNALFVQGSLQPLRPGDAARQQDHPVLLILISTDVVRQALEAGQVGSQGVARPLDRRIGMEKIRIPQEVLRQDQRKAAPFGQKVLEGQHQPDLLRHGLLALQGVFEVLLKAQQPVVRPGGKLVRGVQDHDRVVQPGPDAAGRRKGDPAPVFRSRQKAGFFQSIRAVQQQAQADAGGNPGAALLAGRINRHAAQHQVLGKPAHLVADHAADGLRRFPFRAGGDKIADCGGDQDLGQAVRAALGDAVKFPDGIDLGVEKLDAAGHLPVRGKDVEDFAAQGALALALHHGHPLITRADQAADELGRLRLLLGHHAEDPLFQFRPDGEAGHQGVHRADDGRQLPPGGPKQGFQTHVQGFPAAGAGGKGDVLGRQGAAGLAAQAAAVVSQTEGGAFVPCDQQNAPAGNVVQKGRGKSALAFTQVVQRDGLIRPDRVRQSGQGRAVFYLFVQFTQHVSG